MKPCKICGNPKSYHTWFSPNSGHEFEMDNLLWVENQLKKQEREEKHRKLNFCQICKQVRKSPFGICKECSNMLIGEKNEKINLA